MKHHQAQPQALSIVVPTLNEADNIPQLLSRIDSSLCQAAIPYEVLIVDDHSSDQTAALVQKFASRYPVRLIVKQGKRGKAYSLLEGFDEAQHKLIVMLDADLQYAPEEIVPMYNLLQTTSADVIVTQREEKKTSKLRKLSTKVFNFLFARLLFGIDFDTQSGLKLFRKEVLNSFTMTPSPWSFDLEFLVRSLENNFKIVSHPIVFEERSRGVTKVKLLSTTFELVKASLQLRWRTSARKTRAGYRANSQFLEQTLSASVVVIAALTILSFGHATASADSLLPQLQKTTNHVVAATLKPVTKAVNDLTNTTTTKAKTTADQTTAPTTTAASNVTTANTTTNSATATTNTSATTTAAATTTASQPVASTAAATRVAADSPSSAVVVASADTAKLSPATSVGTSNTVYSSGYPYYKLSASTTHRFDSIIEIILIASAFCILVVSSRKLWAYRTVNIHRS